MALQWISTEMSSGRVIASLPGLTTSDSLRRTLGAYDSATCSIPVDSLPINWEAATMPGYAMLVCYDDATPELNIHWAGYVTSQQIDQTDQLQLSLATPEGYLDRRYVGSLAYVQQDQNTIAIDLINRYGKSVGQWPGLQFSVETIGGAGQLRDRTYLNADNATVYTRLTDLMGILGGPEWMVDMKWADDFESITPVFKVGSRIGTAATPTRGPRALFGLGTEASPGCVVSAQIIRDWSDGLGANVVTTYSSGEGDTAPMSGPIRAVDFQGRPVFEYRYSPSSSITVIQTLKDYATSAVKILAQGSTAITLSAQLSQAPRYGVDWSIGDDIQYSFAIPAYPNGVSGIARCIAYEVNDTTITPILATDEIIPTEEADS